MFHPRPQSIPNRLWSHFRDQGSGSRHARRDAGADHRPDTLLVHARRCGGRVPGTFQRPTLVQRYFYSRTVQLTVWASLLFMVFAAPRISYPVSLLTHEVIATMTAILILNLSQNPRTLVTLENRALQYLGKLSFGLHIYHLLGVVLALRLLPGSQDHGAVAFAAWSVRVPIVALAISIVLNHLSYRYLEQPFLQRKGRFAAIISGDSAPAGSRDADQRSQPAVEVQEPR